MVLQAAVEVLWKYAITQIAQQCCKMAHKKGCLTIVDGAGVMIRVYIPLEG